MISQLPNEADTLRAMLGIGPPVVLDTKPGPLTAGERELIAKRLAAIESQYRLSREMPRGGPTR
jgi:hypothetical protein